MNTKEERWHSTDAFVAACTAIGKINEATGGMTCTIDEINTFQELLKQQGFSILPIEYANQKAIQFAEWLSGEGYQQYDGKERWIAPQNNLNVYETKQLYEMFPKK